MARISEIDVEKASDEIKELLREHVESGHRVTNVKRIILNHLPSFKSLELGQYDLDDDLQRLIGKLDGDIFEYAISEQNECLVCTTYFSRLLREEHGIDPRDFKFSPRQELLIEYARQLAKNPKEISDGLFDRMKNEFDNETIVAITTMGVMMIAMNYFNEALKILPE
ncbi:MAG: hypothetical protein IJ641_04855 [Lachnospiraceae bacterium]|nr:hypothetical protein [Lachnospiraceae bacterium]